jgi:hypothetical protein
VRVCHSRVASDHRRAVADRGVTDVAIQRVLGLVLIIVVVLMLTGTF